MSFNSISNTDSCSTTFCYVIPKRACACTRILDMNGTAIIETRPSKTSPPPQCKADPASRKKTVSSRFNALVVKNAMKLELKCTHIYVWEYLTHVCVCV